MELPASYYVAPAEATQYGLTAASSDARALDKHDFLKLLVAQLRYQDPLQPLENAEFMSQLAQFSTLEELQNLSAVFEESAFAQRLSQAAGMIGLRARVYDPVSGEPVTSSITGVTLQDGDVSFIINEIAYRFEDIIEIYGAQSAIENQVEYGLGLIGKTLTVTDTDGATHTGYAWAVEVHEGEVFVRVGDEGRFPLDEITEVSEPGPGALSAGEIERPRGLSVSTAR